MGRGNIRDEEKVPEKAIVQEMWVSEGLPRTLLLQINFRAPFWRASPRFAVAVRQVRNDRRGDLQQRERIGESSPLFCTLCQKACSLFSQKRNEIHDFTEQCHCLNEEQTNRHCNYLKSDRKESTSCPKMCMFIDWH